MVRILVGGPSESNGELFAGGFFYKEGEPVRGHYPLPPLILRPACLEAPSIIRETAAIWEDAAPPHERT